MAEKNIRVFFYGIQLAMHADWLGFIGLKVKHAWKYAEHDIESSAVEHRKQLNHFETAHLRKHIYISRKSLACYTELLCILYDPLLPMARHKILIYHMYYYMSEHICKVKPYILQRIYVF